ncbi:c-type cytochrome [Coralloluteibacterium thermophilus]|uniref:C-type cytochrome n=1 Tax=Coralloluteibacterium thermophilum TaxID=2707049 RepID=A0ABV9NEK4_9GAMM
MSPIRPLSVLALFALAGCAAEPAPAPAATASADAADSAAGAPPARLGMCVACHGRDGVSRMAGTPHIAGQDEAYMRRVLREYRDNRRNGGPMNAMAGALSEPDIAALAAWYAAQPPGGVRPDAAPAN